jgi:hypothetical protein
MTSCNSVIEQLKSQISGQFTEHSIEGACYLITPFLLPDNTPISLEIAEEADGKYTISDYGQGADYAFVHGVGDGIVRNRLGFVERRLNATVDGGVISKTVSSDDAANAVVEIITGVQDVGYLIYRRTTRRTRETFKADVEAFLSTRGRTFRKNTSLPGATGDREFDYIVRGNHQQLALSLFESRSPRTAEGRAKSLAFDYMDVRDRQPERLEFAVIIDTRTGQQLPKAVVSILNTYIPNVVLWEDRHEIEELLAS